MEPYVMLMRYWKAYSDQPLPKELQRSCLRGCSVERVSTSMPTNNKLPVMVHLSYRMLVWHRASRAEATPGAAKENC